MGKSLHSAKDIVRKRSEGWCERCHVVLTPNVHGIERRDTDQSVHHRQPKRNGGRDSVINMVNLCWGCHREIHEDEELAARDGWIVLDRFPGSVPFKSWRGLVVPDQHGGLTLLDFERGRALALTDPPAPTTRRKRVATRSRRGCRKSRKMPRVA